MDDPTRIDRTLAALRAAWEGQPDLPLGTLFGMLAAESSVLCEPGSPKLYENSDWFQSNVPSMAFEYGSSNSLFGLQRSPLAGSYGPCTR